MKTLRGYLYVIGGGLALLAAAAFVALQWDFNKASSTFSAYGPDRTVPTLYIVLGSAAGGIVVYWMSRLTARGVGILWQGRREQRKIRAELRRAEKKP
jgi:hypothetical protein